MKTTFAVLFFVKRVARKRTTKIPVMCRITVNKSCAQFSTKLLVNEEQWDAKGNKGIGSFAEIKELNRRLNDIKGGLNEVYHDMLRQDNYVTAEKIKNNFLGIGQVHHTLLELFQKHNEDVKKLVGISVTKATLQKYECTRKHLTAFMASKYKISDISLREINHMFLCDFDIYLKTACGCSENTAAKFMQFFRRIVLIARNNGYITGDPFCNYKIRLKRVDRGYLTQEEMSDIMQKKFDLPRLEHVRDIFIFSCYTGLAYIDVKNLNASNVRTSFDGKLWIMAKRQKTNTDVNVPLLDIPLMILKKYENQLPAGQLLPVLSNQKTNSYLKEVADLCGIKKRLTFHLARHTFATTVTLAQGVPIETVSKMLGHTNIKTTQIYARITNSKISHDMKDLADKIKGIENVYAI